MLAARARWLYCVPFRFACAPGRAESFVFPSLSVVVVPCRLCPAGWFGFLTCSWCVAECCLHLLVCLDMIDTLAPELWNASQLSGAVWFVCWCLCPGASALALWFFQVPVLLLWPALSEFGRGGGSSSLLLSSLSVSRCCRFCYRLSVRSSVVGKLVPAWLVC